jgi:hypothetical protein
MKHFQHPYLKSEKLITSLGTVILDRNGSAEVEDDVYAILMSIPENAEHQAKLEIQETIKQSIVPTLEEYTKAGYPADTYENRFLGFKSGDKFDEDAIRKNQEEAKRKAEEELRQKEEQKKDILKEDDLKLLELPELKAIAKSRKITGPKNVTKEGLIKLLLDEEPPPPPHTDPPPPGEE